MEDDPGKGPAENRPAFTRRNLFELAGLAIATAALQPQPFSANSSGNASRSTPAAASIIARLSTYMSEACARALPDDVTEKTKQHILDTLSAMISGTALHPGQAALDFARAYGGKEISTVVASDILCGPIEAALTNGMLAHADETDDSHSPSQSHPGCAVIPAALAVGERFAISGTHFLRAVTLAYDIGPPFTMTLRGQQFQPQSHSTPPTIPPPFT